VKAVDVAVVGAGPFGLSAAASLPQHDVLVFGQPMQTWSTTMPKDMLLRSAWSETSLAAPGDEGSIVEWARREGIDREGPIPLSVFLAYAEWFRHRFVKELEPADVARVEREGDLFAIRTTTGDLAHARAVVVAVGVIPFSFAPPPLAGLGDERVRFAIDVDEYEALDKRRVLVVGGGQAALESAGLAARAGAEVELVNRSAVRWFPDREPDRPRGPLRQRLYRLAYPAVGYGPPVLNRFALHPDLFAALPGAAQQRLSRRMLRPGGSPWLRQLVEGRVRFTEHRTVTDVAPRTDRLAVTLSDGTSRDVDEIIVATGYRCDLGKLAFIAPDVANAIHTEQGWPVLDRYFRSSDPRVFFVGYPAERRFGPMARFVLGARFTMNRVAGAIDGYLTR
jgi:cation diffusion facilitator CzcD-associated flavoprotein CzcO